YRMLNSQLIYGGPTPGSAINPGPLFKVPPLSVGTKGFSGVTLGLAPRALGLVTEEMSTPETGGQVEVAELTPLHIPNAEDADASNAAGALRLKDCADAMRMAAANEKPPLALRARWRLNNAFAGQLCLRSIERLHPLIGARGLRNDSLFLLAWRDIHAAVSQI